MCLRSVAAGAVREWCFVDEWLARCAEGSFLGQLECALDLCTPVNRESQYTSTFQKTYERFLHQQASLTGLRLHELLRSSLYECSPCEVQPLRTDFPAGVDEARALESCGSHLLVVKRACFAGGGGKDSSSVSQAAAHAQNEAVEPRDRE